MIYLDYNATTPVDHRVMDEMLPFFTSEFGNASSRHHPMGRRAEGAVDTARQRVARVLSARPEEIYFTSGATESCNLAIQGIFNLYQRKGKHIVVLATEHKAVLDPCTWVQKQGGEVTRLTVNRDGLVDLELLRRSIRKDTVLVCAMWANNETGIVLPMQEIGSICSQKGTLLFSDATQAFGKIDVSPKAAGVQLLALSAHKIYGPKGVGALYISSSAPRVRVSPLLHGGGHEGGTRSGTLNVPGIVGLGKAAELAWEGADEEQMRLASLRDLLESSLRRIDHVAVNGGSVERLGHVSNVQLRFVDGESLMASFQQELAVASGSACTSADPEPSHVLQAMGLTRNEAKSSLRFSLGRFTTEDEVKRAVELVSAGVDSLRKENPAWKMFQSGRI